jgi:hypothetical protein
VRSQNCEKRLLDSSCLSALLSIRMEQFGFHWIDYHELSYWGVFRKSAKKFKCSLISNYNKGYLTWRRMYVMITSRLILIRMGNVSCKRCRENQNRFLCPIFYFLFDNCAVYELMWKDVVDPNRPRMAHALCMLDIWGYRYGLRIMLFHHNTGCKTRLNITFVRKMHLL